MMAALHPAETALRQATTAANQAVAERTALASGPLRYLKGESCKNYQAGRSSACQVAVMLVGI